ncbi:MAG: T9SS type A sorting domain-containing protein [bacterium]|nr:T9SS type A sorting domain-containing protein [bacterium]
MTTNSRASDISVSIYNTLGEEVATLFNGHTNAGTHSISWSPNSASGVYFVKLFAGEFVTSRKVLYIR